MDSPATLLRPRPATPPPAPSRPARPGAPSRRPALAPSRRAGIALAGLCLAAAWAANTPWGREAWPAPAIPVLAFVASAGSIVAAIGLALDQPAVAWTGAGVFAGIALAGPVFWYAVPFAVGLLACVLAWQAGRPKAPPPAPAPPLPAPAWAWSPAPPWPPQRPA